MFTLKNFTNSAFSIGGNCEPTWKYYSGSSSINTFSNSLNDSLDVSDYYPPISPFSCYRIGSLVTVAELEDHCVIANTWHCLAIA